MCEPQNKSNTEKITTTNDADVQAEIPTIIYVGKGTGLYLDHGVELTSTDQDDWGQPLLITKKTT